jgi:hypothetical protein
VRYIALSCTFEVSRALGEASLRQIALNHSQYTQALFSRANIPIPGPQTVIQNSTHKYTYTNIDQQAETSDRRATTNRYEVTTGAMCPACNTTNVDEVQTASTNTSFQQSSYRVSDYTVAELGSTSTLQLGDTVLHRVSSVVATTTPCFTGKTSLQRSTGGIVNVADLTVGDQLATVDGSTIVTAIYKRPHSGDLFAFDGGSLVVTGDHAIFTSGGWAHARDVAKKLPIKSIVGTDVYGIQTLSFCTDILLTSDNYRVEGWDGYIGWRPHYLAKGVRHRCVDSGTWSASVLRLFDYGMAKMRKYAFPF